WRPQWIYASDLLSCPIALTLKYLGFPVLYHEHDSPSQRSESRSQKSEGKCERFQRFLLWCRSKAARSANVCVLPNERRIEAFKENTGTTKPVFCVWNCPARDEASAPPKSSNGRS